MSAAATVISVVLGLAFLRAGVPKLLRSPGARERGRRWRVPLAFLPVIGAVEVAAAILLLVGAVAQDERPAMVGAALVTATMAGAVITHGRIADPVARALPPALLGALAVLDAVVIAGVAA